MTASPTTRADLAARVLAVIETHRGESAAITAARISEAVGTGDVDAHGTAVRAALAGELEFAKGVVLACARGYFVLADGAEADRYDATLLSRIRKIARRVVITRRKLKAAGWTKEDGRWIAPRRAGQAELFGPIPVQGSVKRDHRRGAEGAESPSGPEGSSAYSASRRPVSGLGGKKDSRF